MIGNLFQSNSSEVFYFNINGFLPDLEMDTEEDRTGLLCSFYFCDLFPSLLFKEEVFFKCIHTFHEKGYRHSIVVV